MAADPRDIPSVLTGAQGGQSLEPMVGAPKAVSLVFHETGIQVICILDKLLVLRVHYIFLIARVYNLNVAVIFQVTVMSIRQIVHPGCQKV